jgi:hypothetical protein
VPLEEQSRQFNDAVALFRSTGDVHTPGYLHTAA